jgi:hypothetical protein
MTEPMLWIPVRLLSKGAVGGEMRIAGMATLDDVVDLDQQLLQHTGVIDSLSYLERFGKVNWNHGSGPGDMLGDICKAEIRRHKGRRGLYIEALLNPEVPAATEAYRFMKGGGRLGFSVQGVTLNLKPRLVKGNIPAEEIATSFISQVALTGEPKNYETFATVVKGLRAGTIQKALTAGSGTDHSTFTGGRSLTRESFATPPREQLAQLARHFKGCHPGVTPKQGERFVKALRQFCDSWAMEPDARVALAQHMIRKGD